VIGAGGDAKLYGWDVASESRKFELKGHSDYILGVATLGENRAVTSAEDGTVRFWGKLDKSACISLICVQIFVRRTALIF
jgi:WD40 repeat protein